uniref:CSON000568 protein n=1 Tax=Culicoides sonorensis TaxID=179676 RepID=A0A336KW62_CULSO
MPSYTLDELLWRHRDLFLYDFDYRDLRFDAINPFTNAESDAILKETSRELQFERMCFIIKYQKFDQKDLIEKFISVLRLDYNWIAEKIQNSYETTDSEIERYRTALYRSEIPKTGDLFVYRLNWLWKVQQAVKTLESGQYLILKSKVGFGKKWIAKDSCATYNIFRMMNNDVFWINLNNCDNDDEIYQKLLKLRLMLNNDDFDYKVQTIDTQHTEHKVNDLKRLLRNILTKYHKNCLLILCGVSTENVLKAFDLGCKILVTTKNMELFYDNIQERLRKKIEIDKGFTRDEAMQLFHKATKIPEHDLHHHEIANNIYDKCKGHPFIISSIAKSFYDLDQSEMKVEEGQWRDWLQKLGNYQIDNYDHKENIEKVINQLPVEMRKYYESLCVFKNDANISFKVLETYWGKSESDVKHIINCFHKLSLIEVSQVRSHEWRRIGPRRGFHPIGNNKNIFVCSLHFIYYSYLKKKLSINEVRQMNLNLVNNYGVHALVSDRSEPKMVDIPDDNYFYYYIGHHLLEAKMFDIFPKLYFDFEFLEGKIRATGLPNTLGDLHIYVNQIAENDYQKQQLLHGLVEFLLSIEEILLKSPDTCLLQYAFNSKDSIVSKEAERQISHFRDRVWFRDSDHSHKYRQIVQLPAPSTLVKFFKDPNAALSVISNNIILLKDLSPQYPVNSTQFVGHESKIKAIEILDDEYFVSLDELGHLRLWSIRNTPVRKRLVRERNENDPNDTPVQSPRQRNYMSFDGTHAFNEHHLSVLRPQATIKCIHFNDKLPYIIAADKNGHIFTIHREGNLLRLNRNIMIKTNMYDSIDTIVYMEQSGYLVVLNENGMASFYDMQTFGLTRMANEWIYVGEKPIGFYHREFHGGASVICVYQTKVNFVQIEFSEHRNTIHHQTSLLYDTYGSTRIVCSVVSEDKSFLMLGTTNGIKVIDVIKGTDLPCRNLNDEITSIDVFSVNDDDLKHILISSTKKNGDFVTLQATTLGDDQSIGWANDRTSSPSLNIADREHLNKSLIGNKIFEVRYVGDDIELILPDDRNRVQLRSSKSNFKPCEHTHELTGQTGKVTAISATPDCIWIGCSDGKIYEIKESMTIDSLINSAPNIVYLKHFSKMQLIGTDSYYYFNGCRQEYPKRIAEAMEIDDEGTVAVIHTDCSIDIFNERKKKILENKELQGEQFRAAAVSKGNYLMIGLQNNHIYAFNLPFPTEMNQYLDFNTEITPRRGLINCMAISADASILAVGFTHGNIEIIRLEKSNPPTFLQPPEILHCNESVNDVLFSPWKSDISPNTPVVLVSLSQEISFWNVNYVINNPFEPTIKSPIRRSARFRPPSQVMSPDKKENSLSATSRFTFNPVNDNLWTNKRGSSDKPELLACIRLSGQAEKIVSNKDFTQFVTVDNEGEIYHLRLFDPSTSSPIIPFI